MSQTLGAAGAVWELGKRDTCMAACSQALPPGLHPLRLLLLCCAVPDERAPHQAGQTQARDCHAVWQPGCGEHPFPRQLPLEHALEFKCRCLQESTLDFDVFFWEGRLCVSLRELPQVYAEQGVGRGAVY